MMIEVDCVEEDWVGEDWVEENRVGTAGRVNTIQHTEAQNNSATSTRGHACILKIIVRQIFRE
jgi:hypothetical protein